MQVTLLIPAPETPDITIHWPNADVMWGHRLRRWASSIPTKTLSLLTLYLIVNVFFLNTLKSKVLNLGTLNVLFDMFIRTGVRKCQPFPTHSTPLSPKQDETPGKINSIGSWPAAGPKYSRRK